eukprot:TRINITY_DN7322_c1_g1_i1.p1 TRINITY_DN7322_c1_g1~~TRINITY_DN7322_c1_g1_i1.p1  ORF type:complete len:282 (-),score=28.46 TRINITY_DN7322_c1_g1_i1:232-1053(-)
MAFQYSKHARVLFTSYGFIALCLFLLQGDLVDAALYGANCTQQRCANSDNMCGTYRYPCKAIGPKNQGLQIFRSATLEYRGDMSYRRVERGSFDLAACERDDAWLQVTYEGTWSIDGESLTTLGGSLGSTKVINAWIDLTKANACLTPATNLPPSKCFNTLVAMQAFCPCNGWDWMGKNIGMFCQPMQECPLLHTVYLGQKQYFTYNASKESACFSKPNTAKERAWERPQDDSCLWKLKGERCPFALASAWSLSTPNLWRLLLAQLSLVTLNF